VSDHIWKTFDALYKTLYGHGRRIEDLETRITALERSLRDRQPEAEVYAERPVLHVVEPEEQPRCPRCERHHSAELPCVPADEAWARHADDAEGVPA
jgi:hypothetical protein